MAKQAEIAAIVAGGQTYSYWQTVEIEREFGQGVSYMTFSVAEPSDNAASFAAQKLGIFTPAQGFLAGQLAITGTIDTRQAAYNKDQHAVMIRVISLTGELVNSTVDGKPGQYRNYSLPQIARAVAAPAGVNIATLGAPPGLDKAFLRVSEHIGETRFALIERLARWRNIHLVDDQNGNLVLAQPGGAAGSPVAALVEGQNIEAARLIMYANLATSQVSVKTNLPGSDQTWGDAARNIEATATNGGMPFNRKLVIAGEQPEDQQGAQMRAQYELAVNNLQTCEAMVTVKGWQLDDGSLWLNHMGEPVTLYSPMLMPSGAAYVTLFVKKVRSYQNDENGSGSEITLALWQNLQGAENQVSVPGLS